MRSAPHTTCSESALPIPDIKGWEAFIARPDLTGADVGFGCRNACNWRIRCESHGPTQVGLYHRCTSSIEPAVDDGTDSLCGRVLVRPRHSQTMTTEERLRAILGDPHLNCSAFGDLCQLENQWVYTADDTGVGCVLCSYQRRRWTVRVRHSKRWRGWLNWMGVSWSNDNSRAALSTRTTDKQSHLGEPVATGGQIPTWR